jgi:serine/threonine protein kinase/DNA-directed RNA polymerase specialized sigma24 family protein
VSDDSDDDEPETLEEAMERYSNGDDSAFGRVYDLVAPRLRRYASRRLGRVGVDAVVERVMISVHMNRGDYEPGAPVMPWVFSFARAAVADQIETSGERPDDDATFTGDMRLQLKRLPERLRATLELVWIEGFTPQQAADLLATTPRAIQAATRRAFQMLEELHQEADETHEHRQDAPAEQETTRSDQDPELTGTTVCGRYRIGPELGHGGMAYVYEAEEIGTGRKVAFKVLVDSRDPVDVERFGIEFKALRALAGNPHVVQVFEEGDLPDGRCFYTMERLRGETVKDRLRLQQRFDWPRTAEIIQQACAALAAVHEGGFVHRDIKPANLFLEANGDGRPLVKLIDFGIARGAQFDSVGDQLTRPGVIPGTYAYVAPERAANNVALPGSDIYSLGVTMFELLAGRRPFWKPGGDVFELAASLTEVPPAIRNVCPDAHCSPEIEAIVRRAIDRDPEHRFQSVAELSTAIAALDRNGRGPLTFVPRTGRTNDRIIRRLVIGTTIIVTIGGLTAYILVDEDPPPLRHEGPGLTPERIDEVLAGIADDIQRCAPTRPIRIDFTVRGGNGEVTDPHVAGDSDPDVAECLRKALFQMRFGTFDRSHQLVEREL